MIRVFLVGDVRLNREGLAFLLGSNAQLGVTGHAAPSDSALGTSLADVVVVDGTNRNPHEVILRIISNIEVPIVVLGAPDDDEEVIALARLGALGFVEKDAPLDDLITTIIKCWTPRSKLFATYCDDISTPHQGGGFSSEFSGSRGTDRPRARGLSTHCWWPLEQGDRGSSLH